MNHLQNIADIAAVSLLLALVIVILALDPLAAALFVISSAGYSWRSLLKR